MILLRNMPIKALATCVSLPWLAAAPALAADDPDARVTFKAPLVKAAPPADTCAPTTPARHSICNYLKLLEILSHAAVAFRAAIL